MSLCLRGLSGDQIATYLREQCPKAEICTYSDGTVAFGRPGEPKMHVRYRR